MVESVTFLSSFSITIYDRMWLISRIRGKIKINYLIRGFGSNYRKLPESFAFHK